MIQLSQTALQFIRAHRTEDVRQLALHAGKDIQAELPFILQQIEGWQKACTKLPLWSNTDGLLYPPHLSMEQCSSEATALYKAGIMGHGHTLVDLTGGFGVDCSYMARTFEKIWYVEQKEELCRLADHNFNALGLNRITVCHQEAGHFLEEMEPVDALFLDPARRDAHGGRTVAISDCTPDAKALRPLLLQKAGRIMIKLSPMLDITLALRDFPEVRDVHIVAVRNECKELLLMTGPEASPITFHAINLVPESAERACIFTFMPGQEQTADCQYATTDDLSEGHFLYEPYSSLLKAGAFRLPACRFNLKKLHPNTHLYVSDRLVSGFPGRIFQIEKLYGFSKKELKSLSSDITRANLAVRNFPASVADLRKRLKLKDGGGFYLFATTAGKDRKVLLVGQKSDNAKYI